jgi:predicted CDP-diglyceride synthetase/phosphatidate cytidylyltransferase
VSGLIGDVRDEAAIIEVLKGLAPVDHVVFSGVDKVIRGDLAELNLDDAKRLFGVKFWGSVIIGKGKL